MNLCKDCRWFQPSALPNQHEYAKCGFGLSILRSPVTGEDLEKSAQSSVFCSTLRVSNTTTDCGTNAKFFEAAVQVAA